MSLPVSQFTFGADPLADAETRQRARIAFLEAMSHGFTAQGAAKRAGVSRPCVYHWRLTDPEFAAEWDEAYKAGTEYMEDEARRRAVDGHESVVQSMGRVVMLDGAPLMERKFSDSLLERYLKRRSADWRDRQQVEVTGSLDLSSSSSEMESKLAALLATKTATD